MSNGAGRSQHGFQELNDFIRALLAVRLVENFVADDRGFRRMPPYQIVDIIGCISELHLFLGDEMVVAFRASCPNSISFQGSLKADIKVDYEVDLNTGAT